MSNERCLLRLPRLYIPCTNACCLIVPPAIVLSSAGRHTITTLVAESQQLPFIAVLRNVIWAFYAGLCLRVGGASTASPRRPTSLMRLLEKQPSRRQQATSCVHGNVLYIPIDGSTRRNPVVTIKNQLCPYYRNIVSRSTSPKQRNPDMRNNDGDG